MAISLPEEQMIEVSALDLQLLFREIRGLKRIVEKLAVDVKKDKIYDTWIDEDVAAAMINMEPRTLRRKAKSCLVAINFRNENGRNYQYNKKDLTKYQMNTSTVIR